MSIDLPDDVYTKAQASLDNDHPETSADTAVGHSVAPVNDQLSQQTNGISGSRFTGPAFVGSLHIASCYGGQNNTLNCVHDPNETIDTRFLHAPGTHFIASDDGKMVFTVLDNTLGRNSAVSESTIAVEGRDVRLSIGGQSLDLHMKDRAQPCHGPERADQDQILYWRPIEVASAMTSTPQPPNISL